MHGKKLAAVSHMADFDSLPKGVDLDCVFLAARRRHPTRKWNARFFFRKKSANPAISGLEGRWFGEIHGETVVTATRFPNNWSQLQSGMVRDV